MSADDRDDDTDPDDDPLGDDDAAGHPVTPGVDGDGDGGSRDGLDGGTDRAIEGFDEGVIDLLSWILDTETRARIYVHLRKHPHSTSKEVAEGTGLYPSTVREALAELHEEGTVTRKKRKNDGAGNNPYEYAAIPPSELIGNVVGDIQRELNALFDLADPGTGADADDDGTPPVTISVRETGDADAPDAGPVPDADDRRRDGVGDGRPDRERAADGGVDDR